MGEWEGAGGRGGVFLTFSRESMCEMLGLSRPTITKAMNDLKRHGLIEEKRPGRGQTNRIYLLPLDGGPVGDDQAETADDAFWENFFRS